MEKTKHAEPHLYEAIVTDEPDGVRITQLHFYAESDNEARMHALHLALNSYKDFDLRLARVYLIDRSTDEV